MAKESLDLLPFLHVYEIKGYNGIVTRLTGNTADHINDSIFIKYKDVFYDNGECSPVGEWVSQASIIEMKVFVPLSIKFDKQILEETNELAKTFYSMMGYSNVEKDFKFYKSNHPNEILCWQMAIKAQEVLTETDVEDIDLDIADEDEDEL